MVEESLGDWILLIKLSEHFDIGRFGIHLWFSIQVPALNAFNDNWDTVLDKSAPTGGCKSQHIL
jgi:hypothetical protein